MPKRAPQDDPRVTDLRSYRKAREQAKRKPPPSAPRPSFLGTNPRAGLILVLVIAVLVAMFVIPRLL